MRDNLAQMAQPFVIAADEVAVSSLAQSPAERAEVAVVRHPIADVRNNVVGYELRFGGSVDLGDPAMDAKATCEFPQLPAPGVSPASAYRAALEWAEDAGRAIA